MTRNVFTKEFKLEAVHLLTAPYSGRTNTTH